MQLRVLSADDVRRALPMSAAIEGMKEAFAQLSAGTAVAPLRNRIDLPSAHGVSLFMPAFLPDRSGNHGGALAIKTVSVFDHNQERCLPTICAMLQLLDAATGQTIAILEGAALTAIRTGAASGAATDLLARDDARTVAVFGSGIQARTQLEAVCCARKIEQAFVYSRSRENAQRLVDEMAGKGPIPQTITVGDNPRQAVVQADIICTATTSSTPVFAGTDLHEGTHVNAIGSYLPEVQEIDAETVKRSLLVVDSRESVLEEAGDLIIPMAQGLIDVDHIHAELGEIVAGQKSGRTADDQITCFKSCGVAVQDAIAAQIAYDEAVRQDLGTMVEV